MMVFPFVVDDELDLDLWPETLYILSAVPVANIQFEAPASHVGRVVVLHDLLHRSFCAFTSRPSLDSTVSVCGSGVADIQRKGCHRKGVIMSFLREENLEIGSGFSRERVEHMACYGFRAHLSVSGEWSSR